MKHTHDEYGIRPAGAEGLQLKYRITQDKLDVKNEPFGPGLATLGTDNEAASPPNPEGMASARRNSKLA